MFRKISSPFSDARSFSSLASSFTRTPKPTPLTSRNSRSLSTYADERVSTARLLKFFKTYCKSGNVSAEEAKRFFHLMVQMEPMFSLYSFNLLLNGLAKNKRYADVVSLYGKTNLPTVTPNLVTLNILLNCSSNGNRVIDDFLVRILRKGYSPTVATLADYSPTIVTLDSRVCIGSRVEDAFLSFQRLEKFGYGGDAITFYTLVRGQRRSRNTNNALQLDEEKVNNGNRTQYGGGVRCKYYSCINDSLCKGSLCKEVKEDNAVEEVFSSSDVDAIIGDPNRYVPGSWVRLFCNALVHLLRNKFKGQVELKQKSIHSMAWETPQDRRNREAIEDFFNSLRMSVGVHAS